MLDNNFIQHSWSLLSFNPQIQTIKYLAFIYGVNYKIILANIMANILAKILSNIIIQHNKNC